MLVLSSKSGLQLLVNNSFQAYLYGFYIGFFNKKGKFVADDLYFNKDFIDAISHEFSILFENIPQPEEKEDTCNNILK